ncbi:MAG: hypothetical protein H0W12_01285 [Chitinophagaceae bacterium]|nr:hypothetical protein [Chitinophagaceae bacterium]
MKKKKPVTPKTTQKDPGAGSNPENKFKKSKSGDGTSSITSVLDQTRARSGRGFDDTGTVVSYDQER